VKIKINILILLVSHLLWTGTVFSSDILAGAQEMDARIRALETPMDGDSLFLESYDLDSGTVNFTRRDAVIPGNSALEVAYATSYQTYLPSHPGWNIDIPRVEYSYVVNLEGYSSLPTDWVSGNYCTGSSLRNIEGNFYDGQGVIKSNTGGLRLVVPNKTSSLLVINDDEPLGLDFTTYPYITQDNWRISCYSENDKEGFKATSPNGITYFFDVYRQIKSRTESSQIIVKDSKAGIYFKNIATLFVSRVEDLFGNWVEYNYNDSDYSYNYNILTSIIASDSREIIIGSIFENDVAKKTVTAVNPSAGTVDRVWKYYTSTDNEDNYIVELPNGSTWEYQLFYLDSDPVDVDLAGGGGTDPCINNRTGTMTIKHPEGAIGTFKFTERTDSIVNHKVGAARNISGSWCSRQFSLFEKSVNTGTEDLTWNYQYSTTFGTYEEQYTPENYPDFSLLTQTIPDNIDAYHYEWQKTIKPDGSYDVSYLNRDRLDATQSKVYAVESYSNAGIKLNTTKYQYRTSNQLGTVYGLSGMNYHKHIKNVSPYRIDIEQNADTYTTIYSNFNLFSAARLQETRFGTSQKFHKYEYFHDTDSWVINKPSTISVYDAALGYIEQSKIEYKNFADELGLDLSVYLPSKYYSFSLLTKEAINYNSEGLLERVEYNQPRIVGEGNHYIEYSAYKRGIPQQITHPSRLTEGSISLNRIVDDNGWITSTTDLNGNTTQYGYDEIGRLLHKDAPTPWKDDLINWSYNPNGTLTRTLKRCILNNANTDCNDEVKLQRVTNYDALLRPIEIVITDVENAKTIYKNSVFNAHNQLTFQSYPSFTPGETEGEHFTYDALHRQLSISQDNGGTITKEYLSGNKIKITDAEDNITTSTYLAYGSPSYAQATKVESPENVITDIAVNIFGNITSITQSGKNGNSNISQTEYRAYDSQQRLCQIKRNDVGATVIKRKTNGEIEWQAQGQTASSNSVCNTTAATADKVSFTYDNLGDQHTISYGDGTPTRTFTLDNNGNIKTITGDGFSQTYNYNSLNLLEDETLAIAGRAGSLTFDYGYDALGHLSSLQYPDGTAKVEFAPNAFGQATQAIRTYSDATTDVFVKGGTSKATYYPNGAVDSFTYGNNIVHKTTLNNRQLPAQITDKYGASDRVNLNYTYDNNLNITSLTNTRDAGIYSLTDLTYDGLDRLTSTTGGNGIGSSNITYDGLGNIRTYSNNSLFDPSNLTYYYKSNFLLDNVKTTGTSTKVRNFAASGSYDARGNVLKNGNNNRSFTYNLANQMTESGGNSYVYDGYNRRIKTQDSKGTSYSFYSQAGKLLYRETEEGGINYIFLGSKLVAKEGTGVKSSGDSIMNYKPFGDSIEEPKDDVGYTGHKFDTDLELSYMQARYYDPVIGRFYSNDPVGYTSANPVMSFNRYMYVNNNPYKYTDPDGEFLLKIATIGLDIADFAADVATGNYAGAAVTALTMLDPTGISSVARRAVRVKKGLQKAEALRDSKLAEIGELSKTQQAKITTVVGALDPKTGNVAVGVKVSGKCNAGKCAEDLASEALGNPKDIEFTKVIRPRNKDEIPRCERCTKKYGEEN